MARFLEGNEAVIEGAMYAGCNFFAGYPITPSSSILLGLMRRLPDAGGIAIQAEDEIASIGYCIGASMSGMKALTVTSGPGMSLYSENIGLAIMGETPLVIVDVQRLGPATGSATKGAQGDIQFVRWGTSGGYPIIALAPTTVEETFLFTIHAFNFAEKYRLPVFVMTSKDLGTTKEKVELEELEKPEIIKRKKVDSDTKNFIPYDYKERWEVPPMSDFGGPHIMRYTTSMHDKTAYLTKEPAKIEEKLRHLEEKITKNIDDISMVKTDMEEGAETLILSYGITARSAQEAVKIARNNDKKVSLIIIHTIWPLPEKEILEAAKEVKKIVVPEMNLGQYKLEIERIVKDKEIVSIGDVTSKTVSPNRILNEI